MVDETTSDATPGETLKTQPPLKNAGTNADASGGPATGDGLRGAGQTIRDEASKLGGKAADRARGFAGENKDRATGALEELSRMMGSAADEVDAKLGEQYGKYARSAAEGVQGFADTLREKDVDDIFDDAQAFVKKSPAIAIGTAALVGFVLARLIKSGVDAAGANSDADANSPAA